MEGGVRPDAGGVEALAALGDDGIEVGERGEMPVGDRLVHQRPEALGGLELRAVRDRPEPGGRYVQGWGL